MGIRNYRHCGVFPVYHASPLREAPRGIEGNDPRPPQQEDSPGAYATRGKKRDYSAQGVTLPFLTFGHTYMLIPWWGILFGGTIILVLVGKIFQLFSRIERLEDIVRKLEGVEEEIMTIEEKRMIEDIDDRRDSGGG